MVQHVYIWTNTVGMWKSITNIFSSSLSHFIDTMLDNEILQKTKKTVGIDGERWVYMYNFKMTPGERSRGKDKL